jgi:hypothetical protein
MEKLIGSIKLKPGLKLYELNTKNMELREIKVKKNLYNPNAIYIQSLNMKNAERKRDKLIKQISKITPEMIVNSITKE